MCFGLFCSSKKHPDPVPSPKTSSSTGLTLAQASFFPPRPHQQTMATAEVSQSSDEDDFHQMDFGVPPLVEPRKTLFNQENALGNLARKATFCLNEDYVPFDAAQLLPTEVSDGNGSINDDSKNDYFSHAVDDKMNKPENSVSDGVSQQFPFCAGFAALTMNGSDMNSDYVPFNPPLTGFATPANSSSALDNGRVVPKDPFHIPVGSGLIPAWKRRRLNKKRKHCVRKSLLPTIPEE